MQTRERAHCARSVFPFIKKKYIYKPKDLGLGEIAADIIAKAARATEDVDLGSKLS